MALQLRSLDRAVLNVELILKWLGGRAGPLPAIFTRPPAKQWLEGALKSKENHGKAKALQLRNGCKEPLPATLKMSSA